MADSYRLRILKALTTHLQGITPGNGFDFDLSNAVYRGRSIFGDDTVFPAISILEPLNPDRDPFDAGNHEMQHDKWGLLLQGWTPKDGELSNFTTDEAHNLMAAVKKRLAQLQDDGLVRLDDPMRNLGGLITEIVLEPGTVRESDFPGARAMFYIRVIIGVAEDQRNPFKVPTD